MPFNLFEDVRHQILGDLILRFGLHQLVDDLLRKEVLPFVVQLAATGDDLFSTPHHLDK